MSDKDWERLKKRLVNQYTMEKYRYEKLVSDEDFEGKKEIENFIRGKASNMLNVLVTMSEYDYDLYRYITKELKDIEEQEEFSNED